jgi:O-acetyl-ADP-ribose deacetylase (regulator of RNase III)
LFFFLSRLSILLLELQGGPNLARDRLRLPVVRRGGVRCPPGDAVRTGPNDYGALPTPYVIHAVGPNYNDYYYPEDDYESSDDDGAGAAKYREEEDEDPFAEGHALLQSAYRRSLDLAREARCRQVAFSLLSAGIYRGPLPLDLVLELGVAAIQDWAYRQLDDGGGAGAEDDRSSPRSHPPPSPPSAAAEAENPSDGAASHEPPPEPSREPPPNPMEVILCAYSPFEVKALRLACRRVLVEP